MEFKIRISRSGTVWLDKIDPATDKSAGEFCLWDSRLRVFKVDESEFKAGENWAKNFAEFTGFEFSNEVSS